MEIKIVLATLSDYPVIQNMARFYVYDLSRECGFISSDWAIPSDGLYESFDFKDYFHDVDKRAFLINVDDEIAGFILLNQKGILPETEWNMGEFFILAKFQGKGIGSNAAQHIGNTHSGICELSVIPENKNAANFWRRVILSYSESTFNESIQTVDYDSDQPQRIVFQFNAL
jgi:predicted acetyltransferase